MGESLKGSGQTITNDCNTGDSLLSVILSTLDQDKAEDVVCIDLEGKSSIADHMVIASGRSSRQVSSICEKLVERIKKYPENITPRTEGKSSGDWALIDAGDVIVHIFRPEVREFYALEKMWMAPPPLSETPSTQELTPYS